MQHYDPSTKEIVKKDRQYGRTLTKEDIEVPFRLFAGNGEGSCCSSVLLCSVLFTSARARVEGAGDGVYGRSQQR